MSVPEGFIVALAARAYQAEYANIPEPNSPSVVYEANSLGREPSSLPYQTRPSGSGLSDFATKLSTAGLSTYEGENELAAAIARDVAGVRTRGWKRRAAIPMTVGLALAQNVRGLVGAPNPPDVAYILERFFAMGAPSGSDGQPGAAEIWARAAQHRLTVDPLVRRIDKAMSEQLFQNGYSLRSDAFCEEHYPLGTSGGRPVDDTKRCLKVHGSDDDYRESPFVWFHRTWTKLCDDQWVNALPARVWVDWANTVLRLAFGMGYLWEVVWYETLAQSVVQADGKSSEELMRAMGALLPWRDSSASVSVRDIAAATRWRVMRSHDLRTRLQLWIDENNEPKWGADDQLNAMADDRALRDDLSRALAESENANVNLWEAINYSLLTRVGSGGDADNYGLLRKNGPRYTVPDPGVEWLAAIASLSCPGPSGSANVASLMADLRALGLRPERGDLVRRLEEAGVARGSADADQAVEIRSAF